jgi:hypothetical protein
MVNNGNKDHLPLIALHPNEAEMNILKSLSECKCLRFMEAIYDNKASERNYE